MPTSGKTVTGEVEEVIGAKAFTLKVITP